MSVLGSGEWVSAWGGGGGSGEWVSAGGWGWGGLPATHLHVQSAQSKQRFHSPKTTGRPTRK